MGIEFENAQRRRWMRPDAARYLRQDYARFLPPGALAAKANFDPEQPRDEMGRWTDAVGDQSAEAGAVAAEAITSDERIDIGQIYAAGLFPRIPGQRPPTSRERTAIAKAVGIWAAEKAIDAGDLIAQSSWLYQALPSIVSYVDAPKPLDVLQSDLSAKAGYDVHHIVERASALDDGYRGERVDDPDNLVRIPRMKHWEINAWYQTENRDFGSISPRDYLRGKDWDERRRVGLIAMEKYGVLKK